MLQVRENVPAIVTNKQRYGFSRFYNIEILSWPI